MKTKISNICLYIVLAIIVQFFVTWINSSFLSEFFKQSLIPLLLSLLAINTATNTLFLSKLDEIVRRYESKATPKPLTYFDKTLKSAKENITDQIFLIIFSIAILICLYSSCKPCTNIYVHFTLEMLLVAIFIYAMDILRDTACAVFKIIDITKDL